MIKNSPTLKILAAIGITLFITSPSWAEVRTINATGEYRMGDNDTRTDAKRLALQDAKRLALEKAGTYIESITEVKNFSLSTDEVRAYTAGIVEVTEQQVRSTMEGETTVVQVEVTCRIDPEVVTKQIDALRKNESAKAELLTAREEAERLRKENDALRQRLAAAASKTEIDTLTEKRRDVLKSQDVNSLLAQAWVAIAGFEKSLKPGSSSSVGRGRARSLLDQVLAIEPSHPMAHKILGALLYEEGDRDGAIAAFQTAIRLKPDDPDNHYNLGVVLKDKGDWEGAAEANRAALRLNPNNADTHLNLGLVLFAKMDLDGAMAAFRSAIRLKPNASTAHLGLGSVLMAKGRRADAAKEFREYLRLTPDTPPNHHWIEKARAMLREVE